MAWTLPRALRSLGASLVHTQYALPLRSPCPAVVTIHDLSFERDDPPLMGRRDRWTFRRVVPRAARGAARVLTVSERSKRDIVERYGLPAERVVVTPNGVDPAFGPEGDSYRLQLGPYALAVGAIQGRKNQLAALGAAQEVGLELVVVGPVKDEHVEADWLLGAFLLMRRGMLDELGGWDEGYRHYVEDIDLCYRAMRAGWERWYVPDAVAVHDYQRVIDRRLLDRRTLWHLRGMARFVRRHPEALLAR